MLTHVTADLEQHEHVHRKEQVGRPFDVHALLAHIARYRMSKVKCASAILQVSTAGNVPTSVRQRAVCGMSLEGSRAEPGEPTHLELARISGRMIARFDRGKYSKTCVDSVSVCAAAAHRHLVEARAQARVVAAR